MSVRVIAKPSFGGSAFVSTPGSPIPVSFPDGRLDSIRGYSCDKVRVSNLTTFVCSKQLPFFMSTYEMG